MMNTTTPFLQSDLREFFAELLQNAAKNQNFERSPLLLDYVAEVLTSFHETAKLFSQKGIRIPVLADMLTEAVEADFYRRVAIFKQMGDTSLVMTGYFPQSLSRRTVSKDYYQKMGGIAYSHLGEMIEDDTVFDELSESFIHLTEVIAEVAENTIAKDASARDLVDLYRAGGSERVLEKLQKIGIVPIDFRHSVEDE